MKKVIMIFLGLLQLALILKSQEKIQLYFNAKWEVTDKSKAVYIRDAEYDLQNFVLNGKVTDRDMKGSLIMEGNYLEGKRNGEFSFYHKTGKIESEGIYLKNKRIGVWTYYYQNGRLKQIVKFFEKNGKEDFKLSDYFDQNGNQLVKNGTGQWTNDSIDLGQPFNASLKRITGFFKDSLKTGIWKLTQISDGRILMVEKFRKGKFKGVRVGISVQQEDTRDNSVFAPRSRIGERIEDEMLRGISHKDTRGDPSVREVDGLSRSEDPMIDDIAINSRIASALSNSSERINKIPDQNIRKLLLTEMLITDTTAFRQSLMDTDIETFFKMILAKEVKIANRKAVYPYGNKFLSEILLSNTNYPESVHRRIIQGTVYVNVAIDSSGNTKEVTIMKGINENFDKEAVRVVALIKKWLPAIQDGKTIESTITIPVKFHVNNFSKSFK